VTYPSPLSCYAKPAKTGWIDNSNTIFRKLQANYYKILIITKFLYLLTYLTFCVTILFKKMKINAGKKPSISLRARDKSILETIKPIVDGIAMLLGENCEVLLHSFESLDRSIVHIRNGHITGRGEGAPITDLGMKILRDSARAEKDVTGCYYSKTVDGKFLRSMTITIRNEFKKPIGMMCINMNMSAPLIDVLNVFNGVGKQKGGETPENFVTNLEDLIKTTLRETITSISSHTNIPNHEKNKRIVYELTKKGIFEIRGAIDIVARELSLSRYTIYNYIRENRFLTKKETL
jgi:predicted transcriptional regulator YheO